MEPNPCAVRLVLHPRRDPMNKLLKSASLLLGAVVLMAPTPTPTPTRVTTAQLGGAERFLTAVSTDKPIYRAGDSVFVRGVVLDARSHAPTKESGQAMIEIK